MADHVLACGLSGSSLRPLAQAAQISDRMLLYYFKDKAEAMAAALARVAERMAAELDAELPGPPLAFAPLRQALERTLFADRLWPYLRLWLEIAALSARGDPLYRAVGGQIGRGFLAWGAARLDCADEGQRGREAAELLVGIEGMLVLRALGLDDICAAARAGD